MSVAEPPRKPSSTGTPEPLSTAEREQLDRAVAELQASRRTWAALPVEDRLRLLDRILADFAAVDDEWVEACRRAEGITEQPEFGGEEWLAGPYVVLRNLRLLKKALKDIQTQGVPRIPGPVETLPSGQVAAQVFPFDLYDRIFFPGVTAEVWMEPGVSAEELPKTQAPHYRGKPGEGAVALVLGAGNVSSIGPMDALYKLFVDNEVVLYKTHPVNDYLTPVLERGLSSLAEEGFFRLVRGGADVGAYLVEHPGVDTIHITGSDKTVEAIVFGPGEEGRRRKQERRPKLTKPISSELGNVSPVIVVPGPWSAGDLAYQAENIASMLTNNAGFNCNATRVVIQHEGWSRRGELLDALRATFARVPVRRAWYPGAEERFDRFTAAHPEAERFGERGEAGLPWTLAVGVDPQSAEDVAFREEAFCSFTSETALAARDTVEFVERAVDFANERLWGTLNATLIVHPRSLQDPEVAAAVEKALEDLRYGTVSVNHWAAVGYALGVTPWGAFPGHDIYDIQSGTGVVHNTLMFSRPQKTVVRSPFRAWPKPPWFASHRAAHELAHQLSQFEADRSLFRLPAITWLALRG
jgi:acyl-CoA reductase-like NAD-dependent aldehyde dehydrogenase